MELILYVYDSRKGQRETRDDMTWTETTCAGDITEQESREKWRKQGRR